VSLPALSSAPASPETPVLTGRRILLVDDDPVLLRVWSRALSQHGLIVRTVVGIAQARQALSGWRRRPFQYVLVDDQLTDGFGLDLVPLLSELRPAPGFAVVSAHPSTERALRAWQSANVIVPKPVSPAGLHELICFLESRRGRARKHRYRRSGEVPEAQHFGRFTLDVDGLAAPDGCIKLTGVGRELLSRLLGSRGGWVPTVQLARDLYERDDPHGAMLVRRQISLLRRALGEYAWIIESALQRGYRIARPALEYSDEARLGP
jgi:DNA-binding response OmpR family regulator